MIRKFEGLTFGDKLLDEVFNGVQPGMYVIAGRPNSGKSTLASRLARQIADSNEDACVLYYALDYAPWIQPGADRFKILDRQYGDTVERIVSTTMDHKANFEANGADKKVCVFIDSLLDVETEEPISDPWARLHYILGLLDDLCKNQRVPIVYIYHLKKSSEAEESAEDGLGEDAEALLTASAVMVCHGGFVDVVKNKLGEFRGRISCTFGANARAN